MNIELRFLQKAVLDKNYLNFTYKNKKYTKINPLKLLQKEDDYYLHTENKIFEFNKIQNIKISKERF